MDRASNLRARKLASKQTKICVKMQCIRFDRLCVACPPGNAAVFSAVLHTTSVNYFANAAE
jgi:hypothetical protein